MSEAIVCPICETENSADATHCEVCGERLVPAEPGEEVGPEESVAEQLSSDGNEVVGFAVEGSDPEDDEPVEFDPGAAADVTADGMPVFDDDEVDQIDETPDEDEIEALEAELAETAHEEADEFDADEEAEEADEFDADEEAEDADEFDADEEADEFDADEEGQDADEFDADEEADEFDADEEADEFDADEEADGFAADEADEADDDEPAVLYSSTDGTAYPKGTPEYEEGFGPMGEELVAEPPEAVEPADYDEAADDYDEAGDDYDEAAAGGFEDDYDEYDEGDQEQEAPPREPSPAFKNAFKAREKERPVMQPLPQPGTLAEPATVTVYVNREPVMRHDIDSDETLIGRKDPVADAYPDVDLTDFDAQAHVSRKHAYIYRQNRNYTLYSVSNAGTQLNSELLELGDRRPLKDGDVIVVAGKIAMKFDVPGA